MNTCEAVMNGTFKGGEDYALTLENGGVGLGIGSAWAEQDSRRTQSRS